MSYFSVALMAIKGPFALYVDMIIDYTIFYYVVLALGGFKIILENITSFPSTVSTLQTMKGFLNGIHYKRGLIMKLSKKL